LFQNSTLQVNHSLTHLKYTDN